MKKKQFFLFLLIFIGLPIVFAREMELSTTYSIDNYVIDCEEVNTTFYCLRDYSTDNILLYNKTFTNNLGNYILTTRDYNGMYWNGTNFMLLVSEGSNAVIYSYNITFNSESLIANLTDYNAASDITSNGTNYFIINRLTNKTFIYNSTFNLISNFTTQRNPYSIYYESTNKELWIGESFNSVNYTSIYNMSGTNLINYPITFIPSGLFYDSTNYYFHIVKGLSSANSIFKYESLKTSPEWTWTRSKIDIGVNVMDSIAYDYKNDTFWLRDLGTNNFLEYLKNGSTSGASITSTLAGGALAYYNSTHWLGGGSSNYVQLVLRNGTIINTTFLNNGNGIEYLDTEDNYIYTMIDQSDCTSDILKKYYKNGTLIWSRSNTCGSGDLRPDGLICLNKTNACYRGEYAGVDLMNQSNNGSYVKYIPFGLSATYSSETSAFNSLTKDNNYFYALLSNDIYQFYQTNILPTINSISWIQQIILENQTGNCSFNVTNIDLTKEINVTLKLYQNGIVNKTCSYSNITRNEIYSNCSIDSNTAKMNDYWICEINATTDQNSIFQNSTILKVPKIPILNSLNNSPYWFAVNDSINCAINLTSNNTNNYVNLTIEGWWNSTNFLPQYNCTFTNLSDNSIYISNSTCGGIPSNIINANEDYKCQINITDYYGSYLFNSTNNTVYNRANIDLSTGKSMIKADTYVYTTSNYGTLDYFSTNSTYRTYLGLNISSINYNYIENILLNLYHYYGAGTSPTNFYYCNDNDLFNETTIISTDEATQIVNCSSLILNDTLSTSLGWKSYNLTNYLINNLFVIKANTTDSDLHKFYSKEYLINTSMRPYISMTYLYIANIAPIIENVLLLPNPAKSTVNLSCNGTYSDVNGQPESGSIYQWFKNSVVIAGETSKTLGIGNYTNGDIMVCEYTPSDGISFGLPVNSSAIIITDNLQPVLNSNSTTALIINQSANITMNVTDINNDIIICNLTLKYPNSTAIFTNQTGTNTSELWKWNFTPIVSGSYLWNLYCTDNITPIKSWTGYFSLINNNQTITSNSTSSEELYTTTTIIESFTSDRTDVNGNLTISNSTNIITIEPMILTNLGNGEYQLSYNWFINTSGLLTYNITTSYTSINFTSNISDTTYTSPDNVIYAPVTESELNTTFNITLYKSTSASLLYNISCIMINSSLFTITPTAQITTSATTPTGAGTASISISTNSSTPDDQYYGNCSIIRDIDGKLVKTIPILYAKNPPSGKPTILSANYTCTNSPTDLCSQSISTLNNQNNYVNFDIMNTGQWNLSGCNARLTSDFISQSWITSSISNFSLEINETKALQIGLLSVPTGIYKGYLSINCSSGTNFGFGAATLPNNEPYILLVVTAPSTTGTGSAGGGQPFAIAANETIFKIEPTNQGKYLYWEFGNDLSEKTNKFNVINLQKQLPLNITLTCENINGTICDHIRFDQNNLTFIPEETKTIIVYLDPIGLSKKQGYIFNFVATDSFGRIRVLNNYMKYGIAGIINEYLRQIFQNYKNANIFGFLIKIPNWTFVFFIPTIIVTFMSILWGWYEKEYKQEIHPLLKPLTLFVTWLILASVVIIYVI